MPVTRINTTADEAGGEALVARSTAGGGERAVSTRRAFQSVGRSSRHRACRGRPRTRCTERSAARKPSSCAYLEARASGDTRPAAFRGGRDRGSGRAAPGRVRRSGGRSRHHGFHGCAFTAAAARGTPRRADRCRSRVLPPRHPRAVQRACRRGRRARSSAPGQPTATRLRRWRTRRQDGSEPGIATPARAAASALVAAALAR